MSQGLLALNERRDCPACGTWTCAACGWKSAPYANRLKRGGFSCMRCGSFEGAMVPTRHRKRYVAEDHEAAWREYQAELNP